MNVFEGADLPRCTWCGEEIYDTAALPWDDEVLVLCPTCHEETGCCASGGDER